MSPRPDTQPPQWGPPPWWPANEPWPPPRSGLRWQRRRGHFLRRMAVLFAVVLTLSAIGAGTLASWLLARVGAGTSGSEAARHPLPAIVLAAVTIAALLLFIFFGVMRRLGSPLGDIVYAADHVAAGDYSVHIVERGPPFVRLVSRSFNAMTAQLQAQDKQRRQLMADVAHELRTPLSVIQGRLEGLVDGVYPRDDQTLLKVVEETRVLGRLVEDLRTLANAEAGNLPLRKEPTDLGILLHDAAAAFAAEAQASGIDVRVEERTELPLIEIDPLRVREVLTNLLANALRHTGRGGAITLAAEARDGRVIVQVSDNGSGIPPDELPKIFDRFYKGAGSQGSGLGLTISRNLVVAHGGEIHATSEVGRGTMMTFSLPVSPGG